ncbi:MAG TPA: sulfotransferase, partial [Panacibacter sp.]|nr:sulfotransferase [Panacibacter sp.]
DSFIIGVQKAGTTTLDDWLSQHPQVYCYDSLKDVHLFGVLDNAAIEKKLLQEPSVYQGEPVVLQSAVNYIFYPQLLKAIKDRNSAARLIVILRNPVGRAISAYAYFKKMLREKRTIREALLYTPLQTWAFSKDNNDFTYIEHGWYYRQIKACLEYFSREQLLVLDYDDLVSRPDMLTKKIFSFLQIDQAFVPDFTPKNITGAVKNQWLQENLIKQGKLKKFIVKYLVDPWMPRSKRKLFKQKMFEMNTGGKARAVNQDKEDLPEDILAVKAQLAKYFIEDTKQLDALLETNFSDKWFGLAKAT